MSGLLVVGGNEIHRNRIHDFVVDIQPQALAEYASDKRVRSRVSDDVGYVFFIFVFLLRLDYFFLLILDDKKMNGLFGAYRMNIRVYVIIIVCMCVCVCVCKISFGRAWKKKDVNGSLYGKPTSYCPVYPLIVWEKRTVNFFFIHSTAVHHLHNRTYIDIVSFRWIVNNKCRK